MLLYKIVISILLFCCSSNLLAQVEVDNKIILSQDSLIKTELLNLTESSKSDNAVTLSEISSNKNLFYNATGQDSLSFNSTRIDSLTNGLNFYLKNLNTNNSNVFIKINNLPYIELKSINLNSLDSGTILTNQIIHVIFYNNQFILLNDNNLKECPNGYISVNDNYCIEINERSSGNYYAAVSQCSNDGARICTMNEWYYACKKKNSEMMDLIGNYEWVDDGTNHGNDAQRVNGNNNCKFNNSSSSFGPTAYIRCCYSKK